LQLADAARVGQNICTTFKDRMSETYQGVTSPNARLLAGSVAGPETSWASYAQRVTGSLLTHLAAVAIIVYLVTRSSVMAPVVLQHVELPNITWIAKAGPGGGGGGGGNKMPDPPKKAEIIPPKARAIEPAKVEPPKPLPQMTIPAVTSVVELPGAVTAVTAPTPSQGTGTLGGGGTGAGSGVGPGTGPGIGPGFGGGFGGGAYREGNGVSSPVLIRDFKPNYTGEAMRARIQGMVVMDAIVLSDGSVGPVRITKSLDSTFGLDQEAIATVKKWRFKPGLLRGEPVPVMIVIEMTFTLR
jgi:TonB family protein